MGKDGFAELKRRLARFIRRYGPPQTVGTVRYRVGLAMFVAPLLLGWIYDDSGYTVAYSAAAAASLGAIPGFATSGPAPRDDETSNDHRQADD